MDRDAFDGLTKVLARRPSRRAALAALAAALIPGGRIARGQAACPRPWMVLLANGVCATPCSDSLDCEVMYCGSCVEAVEGGRYCTAGLSFTPCSSTLQCDARSFCGTNGQYTFCAGSCT